MFNDTTLQNDFAAMSIQLVAQEVIGKVTYKSWEQLQKMNSCVMADVFAKIFGYYNPYYTRLQMMWAIHNWMDKQMVAALQTLTANDNPFNGSEDAKHYNWFVEGYIAQSQQTVAAPKKPISNDMVSVVLELLRQGFSCKAIGDMDDLGVKVSAKQASRIKRGRRYNNVSGVEEVKPVARQYSQELAVFA